MKHFIGLSLVLLGGCASPYRTKEALAMAQMVPEIVFENAEATVQLDITPRGTIHVIATSSGKEYVFLVDTGIPTIVLSAAVARQLALEQVQLPAKWVSGVGGTTNSAIALLPELILGPVQLKRLPVVILDLDRWNQREVAKNERRIDGMIGSNLFVLFDVTIDYQTGTLTLRRPNPIPAPTPTVPHSGGANEEAGSDLPR
jgi:predicted aspartyl protease